jgi:hypothetical protein
MRSGRPIVGLTDPQGDTAATLRESGGAYIAPLDSVREIKAVLGRFVADFKNGAAMGVPRNIAEKYSRNAGARALAAVLDEVQARGSHDSR